MNNFKVGDKCKIVKSRIKSCISDVGKIVTITGLCNGFAGVIDEDVYRVDGSRYNWYEDELELVKPKFNHVNYMDGRYAMHCKTYEAAKTFERYMKYYGGRTASADSWYVNMEDTCFNINHCSYTHKSWYENNGAILLEFEDFDWSDFEMKKEFTKKDLKSGDLVKRRNGDVCIVCVESDLLMHPEDGGYKLSNLRNDLTNTIDSDYDIMAVRRCVKPDLWYFDAFDRARGTLVYERKEVEEMTLEQVCKALGKEIKIVKK